MKETIGLFYEWAAHRGELRDLCMGCYDRFCDRQFLNGKCQGVGAEFDKLPFNDMQQIEGYRWNGWRDLSVSEIGVLAVLSCLICAGICHKGMGHKPFGTSYGYQE